MYADIVIVDSGLDKSFQHNNISGIGLKNIKGEIKQSKDFTDSNGHGTAIYNLIKTHNKEARFFIIKIVENTETSEELLISALEYILKYIDCRIVNLSLGLSVVYEKSRLYEICDRLLELGTIIVSSFENNGAVTFPAAFDNVIGVVSSPTCNKTSDYDYIENSIINILAKGNLQRVICTNGKINVQEGNSFACAHMTGMLSTIWKEKVQSYSELKRYLKESARHTFVSGEKDIEEKRFYIGKCASIFPFNKEIHSLVRFRHLLSFEIADIYDSKYSARIGASTNNLLNIKSDKPYIIKNIDNISYDDFDTLILGHIDQYINIESQKATIKNVILECIKKGKNIYSFDNLESLIGEQTVKTNHIFSPQLIDEPSDINPLGMLYRINSPVLGVFGTSSQQGKFTLQLIMRDYLLKDGYHVGQLGSEPSAYLFGMDECFHFGYNAMINWGDNETITYVNSLLHRISQKKPDIIIVGSQSCTLPWEFGNLDGYALKQIRFLLATNPDAVLLCVNEYDTLDVIRRTIYFIESSVDCKVIGIVVFPKTIELENQQYNGTVNLSNEKFEIFKSKIERALRKPVYLLCKDTDMKHLYSIIIKFFS